MSSASSALSSTDLSDPHRRRGGGRIALLLTGGYLLLMFVCPFLLRRPGVMTSGQELSLDRAMFLSINAGTLTGFPQSIGVNGFRTEGVQGPAIVLLLTVVGSVVTMSVGGMAAARALRLPYADLQIINAALTVELLAVVGGTAALTLAHHGDLPDAVHLSACAFANSGMVMRALPHLNSIAAQGVLMPLSILGGLGLPVLMNAYDALIGLRKLTTHSRIALSLTAAMYVVGTLLLAASLLLSTPDNGTVAHAGTLRDALVLGSSTALDARTAGLPFDRMLGAFPGAAQWLIVLLMMIGASPAGTGGGVKATTFYHLLGGVGAALRGRPVHRAAGIAGAWLGGYVLLVGVALMLLTATEPQVPADRLIFLIISAASDVGLAHDPISVVGPGLFLMSFVMLMGRLAPLVVLWWMAKTTHDAEVLVA